ncbi:MAG: GNAT family N-acetyltransferase [Anaerolineae bacterium]|nr:GNAT family N-acetyltransferase [Anaerolineae bacterium]
MVQIALRYGLILRSLDEGIAGDRATLPDFYLDVFSTEYGEEEKVLHPWTRDLLERHPAMQPADFFVVVDPAQGERIVSALLLIPQSWRYETLDIPTGRVELVATHRDYRRRGLVRALFEAVHARSATLGHQLQAITGISHYYRQFGYAMSVPLGAGASVPFEAVAPRKPDQPAQFTLRQATLDDLPALQAFYAHYAAQCRLSVRRDDDYWRYILGGRTLETPPAAHYLLIVDAEGQAVGYVAVNHLLFDSRRLSCHEYCVGERASYLATFDDVVRGLADFAHDHQPEAQRPYYVAFDGGVHPTVKLLCRKTATGRVLPTYAWYLRLADLPNFMLALKPILEARLANSGARGFTGTLGLDFHDKSGGLWLRFAGGALEEAGPMPAGYQRDGSFPWQMFLNLVFGHRSLEDMQHVLPDLFANGRAHAVLQALFPIEERPAWVMGVW